MKGLTFQGELENPKGNFLVFINGPGILKTKAKEKPAIKKHINLNMIWLQKVLSIITIIKLQLRWLFRGPAPARLQPGETFPRNKACSSLQLCQPIQQSLFHTHNFLWFAPVWRGRHILTSPTAQSHPSAGGMRKATNAFAAHTRNHQASPVHHSAGVAPRRKVTNCTTAETPLVGKFMLLGELVVGKPIMKAG